MPLESYRRLNLQAYEEAGEWFVRFRTGTPSEPERREFDQRLRGSPEFLRAYLEITAIWNEGAKLDARRRWDSDALIASARSAHEGVVEIGTAHESEASRLATLDGGRRARSARRRGHWLIGAGIAAGLLAVTVGSLYRSRAETFATGVGEQRLLTLVDGSTAELNTQSQIEVRYGSRERSVKLVKGEALFHVAKDSRRPFVVGSGNTRVRAVGTEFDVYAQRAATVVSVLEGKVEVAAAVPASAPRVAAARAGSEEHAVLPAGYRLVVTGSGIGQSMRVDPASAVAWTQRQLVFDASPAADIAEEFNRYNSRSLVIEGSLRDVRLSGVFSTSNPMAFVRFLQDRFGARVSETSSEIRVAN